MRRTSFFFWNSSIVWVLLVPSGLWSVSCSRYHRKTLTFFISSSSDHSSAWYEFSLYPYYAWETESESSCITFFKAIDVTGKRVRIKTDLLQNHKSLCELKEKWMRWHRVISMIIGVGEKSPVQWGVTASWKMNGNMKLQRAVIDKECHCYWNSWYTQHCEVDLTSSIILPPAEVRVQVKSASRAGWGEPRLPRQDTHGCAPDAEEGLHFQMYLVMRQLCDLDLKMWTKWFSKESWALIRSDQCHHSVKFSSMTQVQTIVRPVFSQQKHQSWQWW